MRSIVMEVVNASEVLQSLSELKLRHMGKSLESDLQVMPEDERSILLKYLGKWNGQEKMERKSQLIAAKVRGAKFRKIQTIDNYNFKHSAITERIEKNYLALYHSISKDNLPSAVFTGNAGVGKTHLAR